MTQDNSIIERCITRLSLAVRIIDDFTEKEPLGSVSVTIKNQEVRAVKNLSGYYLFTNLSVGMYKVEVQSEFYLPEARIVNINDLDPLNPVITITLIPNSTYPFPAGVTLIRGIVHDLEGEAVPGVRILVDTVFPESTTRARLGPENAKSGANQVALMDFSKSFKTDDILMVKNSKQSHIEFIRIGLPLPDSPDQPFNLVNPLKFNHISGTPLYYSQVNRVLETNTNQKGEFAIYFSVIKYPKFLTIIELSHPNYNTVRKDVETVEGTLTFLGIIQLNPL